MELGKGYSCRSVLIVHKGLAIVVATTFEHISTESEHFTTQYNIMWFAFTNIKPIIKIIWSEMMDIRYNNPDRNLMYVHILILYFSKSIEHSEAQCVFNNYH